MKLPGHRLPSAGLAALVVLAALVPVDAVAGVRRGLERASAGPRIDRVVDSRTAAPTVSAAARALEAMRVRQAFGDDWDELLVETIDGDVEAVLRRHGGTWKGRGLGRDRIRPSERGRALDWYLDIWADASVVKVEPNPRMVHPACRQMSIDILQSGSQLVPDLSTQPALDIASGASLDAEGVLVAVIDSGVAEPPEIEGRVEPLLDMLGPRGPAVVDNPAELREMADDANGHGTAMATLVAAVALGSRILPIRVVDEECSGTAFHLAAGLTAAADAGASVALVSLSTPHESPLLRRAVEDVVARGLLVVAAAGNDGVVEYPAAFRGVIAVTAIDEHGWPPAFAPTGARVDLAAPGVEVVAGAPLGDRVILTGTSPAAAVTAGAAARIVRLVGGSDPLAWSAALDARLRPATDISADLEGQIGRGLLNLAELP